MELLSPDYDDVTDERPIITWEKVARENACVYIGLDALADSTVASAVGASMFSDLTSFASEVQKHGRDAGLPTHDRSANKISIHADEFNELIGPDFIPLLNKAGGAGFEVTVYTQTWSDVEARLGDKAQAGQVVGNLNTIVAMRVREEATAKIVTDQLPEVRLKVKTAVSGVQDNIGGYHSTNQDRVTLESGKPMLQPGDLTRLPKGQAFALVNGGRLKKIVIPEPVPETHLPAKLEDIAEQMRTKYETATESWSEEDPWWGKAGALLDSDTSLPDWASDEFTVPVRE
jgi:conjugative coupling factor TraD (SXT/TOL subfamily)